MYGYYFHSFLQKDWGLRIMLLNRVSWNNIDKREYLKKFGMSFFSGSVENGLNKNHSRIFQWDKVYKALAVKKFLILKLSSTIFSWSHFLWLSQHWEKSDYCRSDLFASIIGFFTASFLLHLTWILCAIKLTKWLSYSDVHYPSLLRTHFFRIIGSLKF